MENESIRKVLGLITAISCLLIFVWSNITIEKKAELEATTELIETATEVTDVTETAAETTEATEVTNEPESTVHETISIEEFGFTEVSSIEEGLDFLFEDYGGYPEVWKEMMVRSIAEEVNGGKVGENVNLDDDFDTYFQTAFYFYQRAHIHRYALDKMLIQNQQNGQVYIYEWNDEMTEEMIEEIFSTLPWDESESWSAMWLRPRIKNIDETFANELKDVYFAREEIWNDLENGDRYNCVSGNIILDSGERQILKDWYFRMYDCNTILCKTVSGGYLIITGWNDYTDTIYYIDDESGSEKDTTESNLLNSITSVMCLS